MNDRILDVVLNSRSCVVVRAKDKMVQDAHHPAMYVKFSVDYSTNLQREFMQMYRPFLGIYLWLF